LPHSLPPTAAKLQQQELIRKTLSPSDDTKLTSYTVLDDVVVPPEYERYVLVKVIASSPTRKNISATTTTTPVLFLSMAKTSNDGYLWVNHGTSPIRFLASYLKSQGFAAEFPESFF